MGIISATVLVQIITSDSSQIESQLVDEIKIGSIIPLTGDLSSYGEETSIAAKLAVTDFNSFLKEMDAPWHLTMVTEDSATNPVIALEKLTSLYAKGIGTVVGPETSSNISHVKGYAESNNMLLISCCSTAPSLAIPNDSVYRLVPNDSNHANVLAKLAQKESIKVIIPVYRGDSWGDGLVKAINESFTGLGGTVDEGVRYNPETPEFSASTSLLAEKVNTLLLHYDKKNIAIILISFGEGLHFMQSASQHDTLSTIQWFGTDGNALEPAIVEDPIGMEFSNAVNFTAVLFAVSDNDKNMHVKNHLIDTLGRVPVVYAYSAYDAVWLIGLSMIESQSSDVTEIKAVLPEVASRYDGALGEITLNDAGDLASSDYEIYKVIGDEWVLISLYGNEADEFVSVYGVDYSHTE